MADAFLVISRYFGCTQDRASTIIAEAIREGLGLPTACALIEKESGARNYFGCDYGPTNGKPPYCEEPVTRERCDILIGENQDFPYGMNGIGPTQLTWRELVLEAEREGGVHRPAVNCRVGFRHMRGLLDVTGWRGRLDAFARYNGSGPLARAYALDFEEKRKAWALRLAAS